MTAGPTPVPPAVSQAMAAPMLYHRAPAFVEVYERVLGKLPGVFQTSNDVLTFSASGSGAMDSAAANLVRPGKPVLACAAGKFGERWIELCEAYGGETVRYEPGWGERLDPAEIDRLLAENDGIEVVLRHAQRDLDGHRPRRRRRSPRSTKRHGAILVVDAVSGLGAAELRQDDWGIDVVVAGSQKALMCPPGLGFASVNQRALDYAAEQPGGPLLLRLEQDRQEPAQGRQPVHAGRRPVPRARRRARHDRGGGHRERPRPPRAARPRHPRRRRRARPRAVRRPRRALQRRHGGRAAGDDRRRQGARARCASSASPPTAARTSSRARSSGSPTAATSARSTSSTSLSGLEMVLDQLGHEVEHGAGVGAAQRVFLEAGVPAAA